MEWWNNGGVEPWKDGRMGNRKSIIFSIPLFHYSTAPSPLRHGQFVEQGGDDFFGGHVFGLGLEGGDDAVAEDVGGDGLDVLRGDIAAALEEGVGAGGEGEVEGGAGRGAVADVVAEGVELVGGGVAGGEDDGEDVVLDLVVDIDFVDDLPGAEDGGGIDDGAARNGRPGCGRWLRGCGALPPGWGSSRRA
jgi:hypothetical protein